MMYRVALHTLLRALLMTVAVIAVGVAAFLIASVVLEWLYIGAQRLSQAERQGSHGRRPCCTASLVAQPEIQTLE